MRAPGAPFVPSHNHLQTHKGGSVFVPSVAPYHDFRPLPLNNAVPVFIPRVAPQHHFFAPPFYPVPGIVIIDVPAFSDTTVITQTVPHVAGSDTRSVERSPSELTTRKPGQLAPFDPTPQEVVERMLVLARVKTGDVLYDLGAGDGRIVITAAKKYGVKAVGFEIDPGLVKLARENVRKQGVGHLVEIRQQDLLTADLSPASVVTLYLSYDGNVAIRPQLMNQLKPGARVVSYTFDMGAWQAKIAQSYRDTTGNLHVMYLWEIGGAFLFSDNR